MKNLQFGRYLRVGCAPVARANNSRKSRPINLREQRTRYFNFYEYNNITTTTYKGTFQNYAK
jgi:hypothetical protein